MSTTPSPASAAAVVGPAVDGLERVFTAEALELLGTLHRRFEPRRRELLQRRIERQEEIRRGRPLEFLDDTRALRADDGWQVRPVPVGLTDRRSEITGPTEAKMAVNALNSGAKVWLADLEDANTPHWHNVVDGQVVLQDARDPRARLG